MIQTRERELTSNIFTFFRFFLRYKNEAKWRQFVSLGVKLITVGGLLNNCLVTGLLLYISHNNYPEGVALQRLHKLFDNQTGINKYLSALTWCSLIVIEFRTNSEEGCSNSW